MKDHLGKNWKRYLMIAAAAAAAYYGVPPEKVSDALNILLALFGV